jgi:hypothetical protein
MKQTSGWLGGTGLEEWRKRMLDGVEKQEHTKLKEESEWCVPLGKFRQPISGGQHAFSIYKCSDSH